MFVGSPGKKRGEKSSRGNFRIRFRSLLVCPLSRSGLGRSVLNRVDIVSWTLSTAGPTEEEKAISSVVGEISLVWGSFSFLSDEKKAAKSFFPYLLSICSVEEETNCRASFFFAFALKVGIKFFELITYISFSRIPSSPHFIFKPAIISQPPEKASLVNLSKNVSHLFISRKKIAV